VLLVTNSADKMLKFSEYISESYFVQYIRDKNVDVLKLKDSKQASWVEVRGKKNYEVTYDKNDPLHKAIDGLGKAASISDLMNGDVVSINPHHPHGKKAIETVERLMK
jgi:hypothetical protein